MDLATVIGFLLAAAMIAGSIFTSGGSVGAFWDLSSLLLVLGGTLGATLMCFPLKTARKLPGVMLKSLYNESPDPAALVRQLVSLAQVARREGMLALEK